jgi:14-3-3 protein epsilon
MTSQRDIDLFLIQILDQANRYQDMVDLIKRVIDADPVLTAEQRDLLSVSYKHVITSDRNGLRYLSTLLERDEARETEFRFEELRSLQSKLRRDLENQCLGLIDLVDNKLLPAAKDPEAQLYYEKLKADHWRYISEGRESSEKEESAAKAKEAYERALQIARESIPLFKAAHLGLILNYSVYLYEIGGQKEEALELARKTYDEGKITVANNADDAVEEANGVLELLRDNIAIWTKSEA